MARNSSSAIAVERKKEEAALRLIPPDDFRSYSLMPKVSDLFDPNSVTNRRCFLRPNIIHSSYPDVESYLDIQFRLFREDFYEALRQSLGDFCAGNLQVPFASDARQTNLHFYTDVTFMRNSFLLDGGVPDRPSSWQRYVIKFRPIEGFDWEANKRLIHGTLVCLWNAKRRVIILGVVANSEPEILEKGQVCIAIEDLPSEPADFQLLSYTLLEADVFYEPYRVVLEAYQSMSVDTLPFKEYLLGWNRRNPGVPSYIDPNNNKKGAVSLKYRLPLPSGSGEVAVENVMDIKSWPSPETLGVNPIQREALHAAVTRRMALIQGPPGTGKTFIGRKIIATLLLNKQLWHQDGLNAPPSHLANAWLTQNELFKDGQMKNFWKFHGERWTDRRCPLVVICLTNQALDQFLEGVLKTTERIIRIGSQSKSAELESYTMSVIKETIMEDPKNYKETAFLYHKSRMFRLRNRIDAAASRLRKRRIKGDAISEDDPRLKRYYEMIEEYNVIRAEAEEALCRNVDVIGLTTTGAARRRLLLRLLKPKIVIVEEAAQVLEAHIVSSLAPSCEHLIMIGDHQQLRPQCNIQLMSQKYKLDISLFERLIMTGLPSVMLNVQHRMRPEVSRLIVPSVYKNLHDHVSVNLKPKVPSLSHNVFFWEHKRPEGREEGGTSYLNAGEAAMVLRLARHLVDQGVPPEEITILATYAAQVRKLVALRKELYWLHSLDRIHVTTVDNYQGEENGVIILSLVRNAPSKTVGFLKTPNRVCVALSRAQRGLFLVGNLQMLVASGSRLWLHVWQVLGGRGMVGDSLPLQCDVHNFSVKVRNVEDFPLCGMVCQLPCGKPLKDCGHPCPLPCRPVGQCEHSVQCEKAVRKTLPCGHTAELPCGTSVQKATCPSVKCAKKLPICGHPCPRKCSAPCLDQADCEVSVRLDRADNLVRMECGHAAVGPCRLARLKAPFSPEDVDTLKALRLSSSKCEEPCTSLLDCGHPCTSGKCGVCRTSRIKAGLPHVNAACSSACQRLLLCGHSCPSTCGELCPPCKKPCESKCPHMSCKKACGEECDLCLEKCDWRCPHLSCNHECYLYCNRAPCSLPCPKKLLPGCGHPCPGLCGEECPPSSACPTCVNPVPSIRMIYLPDCGHLVPVADMDLWLGYCDPSVFVSPVKVATLKSPTCPTCFTPIRFIRGRYGDHIKAFLEDLAAARTVHQERKEKTFLEQKVKELLKIYSPGLLQGVEPLLTQRSHDECWDVYKRMFLTCWTASFKDHLSCAYVFTRADNQTESKVSLQKRWLDELSERCDLIGKAFLAARQPADLKRILDHWHGLELLRQCRTMQSIRPASSSPRAANRLLSEALALLKNETKWNLSTAQLDAAAEELAIDLSHPERIATKDFVFQISMEADGWTKCPTCETVSFLNGSRCANPECGVPSLQNLRAG